VRPRKQPRERKQARGSFRRNSAFEKGRVHAAMALNAGEIRLAPDGGEDGETASREPERAYTSRMDASPSRPRSKHVVQQAPEVLRPAPDREGPARVPPIVAWVSDGGGDHSSPCEGLRRVAVSSIPSCVAMGDEDEREALAAALRIPDAPFHDLARPAWNRQRLEPHGGVCRGGSGCHEKRDDARKPKQHCPIALSRWNRGQSWPGLSSGAKPVSRTGERVRRRASGARFGRR